MGVVGPIRDELKIFSLNQTVAFPVADLHKHSNPVWDDTEWTHQLVTGSSPRIALPKEGHLAMTPTRAAPDRSGTICSLPEPNPSLQTITRTHRVQTRTPFRVSR